MIDNEMIVEDIDKLANAVENNDVLVRAINVATEAMNTQVQGILNELNDACTNYWKKQADLLAETAQAALESVTRYYTDIISQYDFSTFAKNLYEANTSIWFLGIINELKWPLFLIDDEEFKKQVVQKDTNNEESAEMEKFFCEYCETSYFPAMEKMWCDNKLIRQDRIPILQEALSLHCQKYYYASTSILMCQLYGIVSDIVDNLKKHDVELDISSKKEIAECYEMEIDNIDSEKGKMLQAIALVESGYLAWNSAAEYLKREILCSSDSKKKWEKQPLRNKICHGKQLNFGTREHSIKAILTVDILMQLTIEVDYVISKLEDKAS